MKTSEMKKELKAIVERARKMEGAYEVEVKVTHVHSGYAIEEQGFDNYLEIELFLDDELRDEVQMDMNGSKAKTYKLGQDVTKYLEGCNIPTTFGKRVDR